MRLFKCRACGRTVFFENIACVNCGHALGFLARTQEMLTLTRQGETWRRLKTMQAYRYCANAAQGACNWVVPAEAEEKFCAACRHNRTIPDLSAPQNLARWRLMETAKHRLFYTLIALNLPLRNLADDPAGGLAFDFLADPPAPGPRILTGHDNGLITINLAEADDALRESFRREMGEPYRTLLGHFRHESGHHYWNVLLRDAGKLDPFRAMFGDETRDYGEALQQHYQNGPPADWEQDFISAYAASHPWEDFAESWAHYLHIVETLETASAFGLRIHPGIGKHKMLHAAITFDPHKATMESLIAAWLPLTVAVNSLNRSMGLADLYPFALAPKVVEKLEFIHRLVHDGV